MVLFKKITQLQQYLAKAVTTGQQIGFVPTMGALHEGHLQLVKQSLQTTQLTVCSIFVNPTQFNDANDFDKYPITLEADIECLEQQGCHVLFIPSVQEMYPTGVQASQHYPLGNLENVLEGAFRPNHYQGVCQVVHRLLDIVQPHQLFLGQKDFQQCMVLQWLVDFLALPTQIHIVPTVRNTQGLALSSRNTRLTAPQQQQALAIYQNMAWLKTQLKPGKLTALTEHIKTNLLAAGFEKIDYVAICEPTTLAEVQEWDGQTKLVVLIAAFLHGVRLIDNEYITI